jgi:hypothetical protein
MPTLRYLEKNSEEFSYPCFTFHNYFEKFTLSIFIPSTFLDDLGLVLVFLALVTELSS